MITNHVVDSETYPQQVKILHTTLIAPKTVAFEFNLHFCNFCFATSGDFCPDFDWF